MKSGTKNCQNCKKDFVIEPKDFDFYEKIKVPPPTFCPECRTVRRFIWRNEMSMYHRTCLANKHVEKIVSIYSQDSLIPVYDYKYWWSDEWDPLSYGRIYDFNISFFNQWGELNKIFPHVAMSNSRAENSEYCNVNDKSKNCYLMSAAYENERVAYANRISYSKDTQDSYIVHKCELCYEIVNCESSFRLLFSNNCRECLDSAFLYDCRDCSNCLGCINLRNKSYYIFNKQYTKEEYKKELEKYNLSATTGILNFTKLFRQYRKKQIYRYAQIISSVNSTGDNLVNSKNSHYCFDLKDIEDCKFSSWGGFVLRDSYDAAPGTGDYSELLYDCFDMVKNSQIYFSSVVYDSHNIQYSFNCYNSSNLFGCIGLRKKSYCILNKQYTKEEYEELVSKIIEHMNDMPYIDSKGRIYKYGEFFPSELSPFCYNETIAQEYFPLTKEEAIKQGYKWKDREKRNYQIDIKNENIPDNIEETDDSIIGKVLECEHKGTCNEQCTEAFKIIPAELQFYQRMNLPIPHLCPNCRHYQRLKQRNPLKLWHRTCMCDKENHTHKGKCEVEFETSYAPKRPEIVYCEKCYQQEVY